MKNIGIFAALAVLLIGICVAPSGMAQMTSKPEPLYPETPGIVYGGATFVVTVWDYSRPTARRMPGVEVRLVLTDEWDVQSILDEGITDEHGRVMLKVPDVGEETIGFIEAVKKDSSGNVAGYGKVKIMVLSRIY